MCRRIGATLIIAKLDRLARNVAFVSNLMESGVEFTAVDFPTANRLTIHILAAVAEHEAAMTSTRTKAALAAAKARGTKLGNPNLTDDARAKGREAARKVLEGRTAARAADLAPVVAEIKAGGRTSLRAIAAELDARGIPAPRGGKWTAPAVMRLLSATPG
jgi:DNA invertase Pin-like site-specific DNA recombinase